AVTGSQPSQIAKTRIRMRPVTNSGTTASKSPTTVIVLSAGLPTRGPATTAEDVERDDEQERERSQLHRVDERWLEDVPNGPLLRQRRTEVTPHHAAEPVDVLDDGGSVGAVLVVPFGDRLVRGVLAQHEATPVAGEKLCDREDDRAQQQQGEKRETEAL